MSVQIDTSSISEASAFPVLSQLPTDLGDGRPAFCVAGSGYHNLNNNSAFKTSSTLKYRLNYGLRLASEDKETPRREPRIQMSGLRYLKQLPTVLARQRDVIGTDEDKSTRPTFPDAASVSLPTSTTTLEYLLHRRSSRAANDETPEDSCKEATKTHPIKKGLLRDLIRTFSASDANYVVRDTASDQVASQFLCNQPCLYTYQVILKVAKILDFLQNDNWAKLKGLKPGQGNEEDADICTMDNETNQEQIKIFQLTFTVLKFQKLFKGALAHTDFFTDCPALKKCPNLVTVIMYDLQNRRYQRRPTTADDQSWTLCKEIEDALIFKKTRLQSFIAKERVKHNAPSLDSLLPTSLRTVDEIKSNISIHFWVNQFRTTWDDIVAELETEGFTQLEAGQDITAETGNVFQIDKHCSDLLTFPSALGPYFSTSKWAKEGQLVQQDKTSCLAAESVQHLLSTDKDVIHVNVGTGLTTAHLASLLKKRSPLSRIWGFGIGSARKIERTIQNVEFLGAGKNTKFLIDDFLDVDPEEARLKLAKVILITANCSMSAVTNPIQFVITEKEGIRCLGNLFNARQGLDDVTDLAIDHGRLLKHALSFPRVHAVVYSTRSCYQAENESVVAGALEYIHATNTNKGVPFRVTPPVLPFTFGEINSGESGINDRYVKFLPTEKSNGCFVAIISREPDDHRDSARSSIPIKRLKELLGKATSFPLTLEAKSIDARASDIGRKKVTQPKRGKQKLKETASAPEAKGGIRSKLAGHKSAAAFGARLYQVDLVQKMEDRAKQKSRRSEHTKSIPSAISLGSLPGFEVSGAEL